MTEELDLTGDELAAASVQHWADADAGGEHSEETEVADDSDDPGEQNTGDAHSDDAGLDQSVLETFPEDIRTHLEDLPPDVVKRVQEGYLRRDKFTSTQQELAEERKRYDTNNADAESWRRLIQNPDARGAVLGALNNAHEQEAVGDDFDWTDATSEEIDAAITARAETIVERKIHERVEAPQARAQQIKTEALKFRGELGEKVTDNSFQTAWTSMLQSYGEGAVTPENARHLVAPFVQIEQLKQQVTKGSTQISERVSKAATNPGARSASPTSKPAWVSEGRNPTEEESLDATLSRLKQMTGTRWSEADLNELINQG